MTKLLAARQIVTSMVTGILLWCVIGIGVSVLVSATLVLGYALFIVKDALAPAALSGAVQGLWLYLATRLPMPRGPSKQRVPENAPRRDGFFVPLALSMCTTAYACSKELKGGI